LLPFPRLPPAALSAPLNPNNEVAMLRFIVRWQPAASLILPRLRVAPAKAASGSRPPPLLRYAALPASSVGAVAQRGGAALRLSPTLC